MRWTLPAAVVPSAPTHPLSWWVGWTLLLASFVAGAIIGLFSHRDDFLGGYHAYGRRMVRLGHIALAALGIVNVVYAISPWPVPHLREAQVASALFIAGGILMPAVCFLSAWRKPFRHLFALPVLLLLGAVVLTLVCGGSP